LTGQQKNKKTKMAQQQQQQNNGYILCALCSIPLVFRMCHIMLNGFDAFACQKCKDNLTDRIK